MKSDVFRNMPWLKRAVFSVLNLFMARESKTGIYLSTAGEVQGMTGQLFVGKSHRPLVFEKQYRDGLWDRTERMLAQVPAG